MAKNDQDEAYEKVLTTSLARVTDWLKFAETKNGALLAFVSAWTVAIANIASRDSGPPGIVASVLPISAFLFIIAGLVLLVSFIPRINLSSFYKRADRKSRPPNLVFYGDISDLDNIKLSKILHDKYRPTDGRSTTDEYLADIISQIHVNSRIARQKFTMFKVAGWITILGIAVLAFPIARTVLCRLT